MNTADFRRHGHELIDWITDYFESIRDYPVRSQAGPGEVYSQLPKQPPAAAESFDLIFRDFEQTIMPGMTHWQHPSFFAYFPANSSPASVLGELLTSALGAQCMIWQTSPAAAELEELVMSWLKQMLALPDEFTGVIQDTASTATLCSILTAREHVSDYCINNDGLHSQPVYAVYCSSETHSSIEKAVKIAGLGKEHLRKVQVDETFAMMPHALEKAILDDIDRGIIPLCVIGTIGTTGSTAVDPIREIGEICREYDVWFHVDAAFSGTALLLPEMRWMADGLELADTFVFNPHKWMATNFDCSAYFVKDKGALIRTFEILPEYLRTAEGEAVNNYRDWGIPLGRRFRALKLWFVIRSFGVTGLQDMVKRHIGLAKWLAGEIESSDDFELLAPTPVALVCFRYHPKGVDDTDLLNRLNESLLAKLNATGKIYLTHTKLNGAYTLRMSIAQTGVQQEDVSNAWALIQQTARLV